MTVLSQLASLFRRSSAAEQYPWPSSPDWTPTHRHKKGGLYRRIAAGVYEADRSDVVIYDDAEGTIWVRALAEFEDGRFTPLS